MAGGTDFLIEIEQRVKGANPVTELQATSDALTSAKKKYAEFERAVGNAGKRLDAATANVAAVRAKMQSAMEAGDADAFWKLAPALEAATSKQEELATKATEARGKLDAQAQAVTSLADAYIKLKSAEDAASQAEEDLKNRKQEHEKADKALQDEQRRGLEQIAKTGDGLTKLPGPLGVVGGKAKELTEGWRDLSEQLGQGRAMMLVAGAAAVALVAILVAGAVAIARWAIGLANARRNTALTMQALLGSAEAAKQVQDSFGGITRATGIAGDRLLELTRELKAAKVSADDMPAALKALAQQESALGDSSGTSALIEELKNGKKSVAELGQEMAKQYGDIAAKKAMGLDQQMVTLKENISELFGGSNIEGFLKGVQRLVGLFDKSTASGKALQAIFSSFMGPLGGVEGIFISIERFILGTMVSGVKLATVIKRIAKALGFDTSSLSNIVDAADLGKAALFTLLIPFAPIMLAIAAVVAVVYALINTWQTLSAAASAVGSAISSAWEAASTYLSGIDLGQVGIDIVTGLANGIKNAGQKVVQAITGVVGDAIAQAKSLLKIASPSKVFEQMGGYTAEGFAGGVDKGADRAQESMADLVAPPPVPATQPAARSAGARTGPVTIQIVIQGNATTEVVDELEDRLAALLERLGLATGATPAPAGG
jgi:hypothetical protein